MFNLTDNQFYPSAERIWFCIRFAKWACDRLTEDADYDKKESSFQMKLILILAGMSTSKIVAFWAQKTRTHTLKSRHTQNEPLFQCGIIGPFFFENEPREAVTVNGDRYRAMLNEFSFTKIEEEDIGDIWFQQDGATCHKAEAKLDVFRPVFEHRIISRRADVVWPHRSCNLTLMDCHLQSAVKVKCYADKPETIDALKNNIRETIDELQLRTIDNVLQNWTDIVAWLAEAAI